MPCRYVKKIVDDRFVVLVLWGRRCGGRQVDEKRCEGQKGLATATLQLSIEKVSPAVKIMRDFAFMTALHADIKSCGRVDDDTVDKRVRRV